MEQPEQRENHTFLQQSKGNISSDFYALMCVAQIVTYVVSATESKNGPCLVTRDTLLDFEHIAVEFWAGAKSNKENHSNALMIYTKLV